VFGIYLIGLVVTWAVGFYLAGRFDENEKGPMNDLFKNDFEILTTFGGVGVFWPLVLVIAVVLAPFILIYKLGAKRRAKAAAKKTVD